MSSLQTSGYLLIYLSEVTRKVHFFILFLQILPSQFCETSSQHRRMWCWLCTHPLLRHHQAWLPTVPQLPRNCSQCPCLGRSSCTQHTLEPCGSAACGTGASFGSIHPDAISWIITLLLITDLFKSPRGM